MARNYDLVFWLFRKNIIRHFKLFFHYTVTRTDNPNVNASAAALYPELILKSLTYYYGPKAIVKLLLHSRILMQFNFQNTKER